MYLIKPKIIVKKKKFLTQSSHTISTSRPRYNAFVPIPAGIEMNNLDEIFEQLTDEMSLYSAEETSFDDIVCDC